MGVCVRVCVCVCEREFACYTRTCHTFIVLQVHLDHSGVTFEFMCAHVCVCARACLHVFVSACVLVHDDDSA